MKKTITELWSLLIKDFDWKNRSVKQRIITVWFGLSFCLLGMCGESLLLAIPAIVNFAAAAYHIAKYVPVPEE